MMVAPNEGKSFEDIREVYYGTDDGFLERHPPCDTQDDRHQLYETCQRYEGFYRDLPSHRRENIHLATVIGGLFSLNLIPIFKPKMLTFFDVNPHAITLFDIVRRVWIGSKSSDEFLRRLADASYDIFSPEQRFLRECIVAKMRGTLTEEDGRTSHSFLHSWRYALERFELTRTLLKEAPVQTFTDGMHTQSFQDFVAGHENLWLYCSNIFLFKYFELVFHHTANATVLACYHDRPEIFDVTEVGAGAPVTVNCRIPITAGFQNAGTLER